MHSRLAKVAAMEGRQIFLDPTGRRRRAVIVIGLVVATALVATIAVVVAGTPYSAKARGLA